MSRTSYVYQITTGFLSRGDAEVSARFLAGTLGLDIEVQTIEGWLWNDVIIKVTGQHGAIELFNRRFEKIGVFNGKNKG